MTRIITRDDEDKFLKEKIADYELFREAFTFGEIIDALRAEVRPLSLSISEEDGTEVIDESNIEIIEKSIKYLTGIFSDPRSFIRSSEEKVPVEIAKRINQKAISVLSRDSNDWHSRTVLSVKPKSIVADVNEESYDIYENRFVCTLIDKVFSLVREARIACEEERDACRDLKASDELDRMIGCDSANTSLQFFNKIYDNRKGTGKSDYELELDKKIGRLIRIEDKIRLFRLTKMYRSLRNKRVHNPIQKTNILMYDYNYNQAFRLWKYLEDAHLIERKKLVSEELGPELLEQCYSLYVFLCLCASLHDLDFTEESSVKMRFDNNGLSANGTMRFHRKRDDFLLSLSVKSNEFIFNIDYPSEELPDIKVKQRQIKLKKTNRERKEQIN